MKTVKHKAYSIKANTYSDIGVKNDNNNPKFEVSDCVIISRYENCFAKGYTLKENLKIRYHGYMKQKKPNKMFGMFHEKELQNSDQPEFRIE